MAAVAPCLGAAILAVFLTQLCGFVAANVKKDNEPVPLLGTIDLPAGSDAIHGTKLLSGKYLTGPHVVERPYFDDVSPRNVTAIVGQSAILHCRVKHLGQRTVSWMRKRDLHILTSNIFTYTGDARFSVIHPEGSDDWNLKIEYVQERDAGIYECQVNTEPKINMAILLHAEAAQATIQGPEDVYVKKGSTISLTCSVNVHSTPPSSVLWYHGPSVVDFDSPRGGISLETEKTEKGTTSKLLVTKASLVDSGNYTCVPSNANPASVWVHVLNGEHPAAMQHGEHSAGGHLVATSWPLLPLLVDAVWRHLAVRATSLCATSAAAR